MAVIPRLYNTCLLQVSLFLKDGIWNSCVDNPFCNLPLKIVDDLASTILRIKKNGGFKAEDLKLLLTSGTLRKFKLSPFVLAKKFYNHTWNSERKMRGYKEMEREIIPALKYLSSACENLEVIQVIHPGKNDDFLAFSDDLQKILENSPNLKEVHCKVKFKLTALRNCKKLQSIKLHFVPQEPWYDFLEVEHGNEEGFKPLESLEIFELCDSFRQKIPESVVSRNIGMLLKYCPSLTSFGRLDTSRALAQLKQEGILLHLKLRCCDWPDSKCFQDAVEYHPFVEDLCINIDCNESIVHLKNLKSLTSLRIHFDDDDSDFNIVLGNVLKDIGAQLKHLRMLYLYPTDISTILKKCPNLEALQIISMSYNDCAEPDICLPYLKCLILSGYSSSDVSRFLHLFTGCHNLTELFVKGECDDNAIEKFVSRNSLSNLKKASIKGCQLTERGFKDILLNAPNLKKFNASSYADVENVQQRYLKSAVIETKHKADITAFCVDDSDEFFLKKYTCKHWY